LGYRQLANEAVSGQLLSYASCLGYFVYDCKNKRFQNFSKASLSLAALRHEKIFFSFPFPSLHSSVVFAAVAKSSLFHAKRVKIQTLQRHHFLFEKG